MPVKTTRLVSNERYLAKKAIEKLSSERKTNAKDKTRKKEVKTTGKDSKDLIGY